MALIVTVVVVLLVAGILLWAVPQLPIDPTIAKVVRVIVIVACVLYALAAFTGQVPLLSSRW